MNKKFPPIHWERSPFDDETQVSYSGPARPTGAGQKYVRIEQQDSIPKRGIRNPSLYVPRIVKELSPEQAQQRRNDFVNNPAMIEDIEKLEKLVGKRNAHDYFSRVLYNLKYEEA